MCLDGYERAKNIIFVNINQCLNIEVIMMKKQSISGHSQIYMLLVSIMLTVFYSCTNSTSAGAVTDSDCGAQNNDTAAAATEDVVSAFVVYGVDMNSSAIKEGDFIWMGDLPNSDRPDSSYDGFTLPITGSVVTFKKSTVRKLAPSADTYIIDGKKADESLFEALDEVKIQRVTINGDTLVIETRFSIDEPNPDLKIAVDEESRLFRRAGNN